MGDFYGHSYWVALLSAFVPSFYSNGLLLLLFAYPNDKIGFFHYGGRQINV